MLPQVIEKLRENGKQIDVVVIETIQKLRDITIDDIMNGKTKSLHSMIGRVCYTYCAYVQICF